MAQPAEVQSVEALGLFRSELIIFLTRLRRAVDDTRDEVMRTRAWVEQDRLRHWEHQLAHRRKVLDQAEQELLSARMSMHPGMLSIRQSAVRKARTAVGEAEEKLRAIKKIARDFEPATAPRLRSLETISQDIETDLARGIRQLEQLVRILESYGGSTPKPTDVPPTSEPLPPESAR